MMLLRLQQYESVFKTLNIHVYLKHVMVSMLIKHKLIDTENDIVG